MSSRAPWCLRWSERSGWTPLRSSLALGALLASAFLGLELACGRVALWSREPHVAADTRVALALIALLAYLPGAFAAAVQGAERTLAALAPAFAQRADAEAARATVFGRNATPALRRLGWTGVLVGLAVPIATNFGLETWDLPRLPLESLVHRALLPPIGWLGWRFSGVIWSESRRLSQLGAGALRVDLLDLRPLAPLADAGMRHALLGAGAVSAFLFILRDATVAPGLPVVVAVAVSANVALSAATLWLAVRGGHLAIRREKAEAMAVANHAIRALRQPGAAHAAGALADALAWKRFVADAPDWPIDFPTLQRFVIPLALPFASLVAGAVLQLALERALPA